MKERSELVKELFEHTDLYLTYDYNLRIRKETVAHFTAGKKFAAVLDMPCGTGSISLPLLEQTEHLTLIDISANMIKLAGEQVPQKYKNKVTIIQDNLFNVQFENKKFDLVICLGLLAHVDSPEQLLKKLGTLVAPGGSLIIQNTSSSHFYSYLIRTYLFAKGMLAKQPYRLNKVKAAFVEDTLRQCGLEMKSCFRYNQSFLGFSNLFSNEKKYAVTRNFFGDADGNKHASWGSDYTYLFVKNSESAK